MIIGVDFGIIVIGGVDFGKVAIVVDLFNFVGPAFFNGGLIAALEAPFTFFVKVFNLVAALFYVVCSFFADQYQIGIGWLVKTGGAGSLFLVCSNLDCLSGGNEE